MDYLLPVYYAVGATGWSLMRYYYKQMGSKKELRFEPKRLVKTVVIGIGLGLYAAYTGQAASPDVFQALSTSSVVSVQLTAVADTIVNFVLRVWKKYM